MSGVNESQLIDKIKAHIAKGDKAKDKAEQHYISAGQYLATLKKEHAGNWDEWAALLKTRVGISTGRASELMQIADGRKTVAQIRADKAESVRQLRARSSLRSEEGSEEDARATLACCGREVRIRPCGHADPDDAYAYSGFDKGGNPVWISSCCGQESPKSCQHDPVTALLLVRQKAAPDHADEPEASPEAVEAKDAAAGDDDGGDEYVAPPEEIKGNFLDTISRHKAVAEAMRKITKVARFDDAARAEVDAAIDLLIRKWKVVRSTLKRGGQADAGAKPPSTGNGADPEASAETMKARFAALDPGPMPECLRRTVKADSNGPY